MRTYKRHSYGWWTLLAAGAGLAGFAAQATGLPASWLIGPMLVAIAFALARRERAAIPDWAVRVAQAVIGMILAASFRPSALPLLVRHLPEVVLITGGTLLLSVGVGTALARLSSVDRATAALGTLPGGATGMIAMSTDLGADTRLVALMQYARVVLVVLSAALLARFVLAPDRAVSAAQHAPAIATDTAAGLVRGWPVYPLTALLAVGGIWLGQRVHLPAAALLGPLITGIIAAGTGIIHPAWPAGLMQLSYTVLGVYVGLLFDRASLRRAGRLLPLITIATLGLMVSCALLGWFLSALTHDDYLTGYLATTPGGLDSITILALGSGADVSLVLAVQMVRFFLIVFAGPPLARTLTRGPRALRPVHDSRPPKASV